MQWTKDLSVGIEEIDNQHKELFARINNLVNAIKQHRCKEEIDGTLRFLEEYAKIHFTNEEKYMRESRYEGSREHEFHHARYIQNLAEIKKEAEALRAPGVSYDLSVMTNQMAVDWIVDHIMKIDKKFGEFLRSQGREQSRSSFPGR